MLFRSTVHLVECVPVSSVNRFVSERSTYGEEAERWLELLENTTLEGGALGAEQVLVIDIERVLIVHSRMIRRIVQDVEIVTKGFQLR